MILNILLILVGIALVFVFLNRKKDEDKARLAIMVLTITAIVLALVRIFSAGGGDETAYDPSVDDAVAQVAADRIADAAEGRRMVIIADVSYGNVFAQTRLDAFRHRMERHEFEILGVEAGRPEAEDLEEGVFLAENTGISQDAIENALRNYSDVQVIVSLSGMPSELNRVARPLEKIEFYVFEDYPYEDWTDDMARGVLNGIIVAATDSDWSNFDGSHEQLFDQRYIFVTPKNFNEVRDRLQLDF